MKAANLALRFFLELAALATLAWSARRRRAVGGRTAGRGVVLFATWAANRAVLTTLAG